MSLFSVGQTESDDVTPTNIFGMRRHYKTLPEFPPLD